MMSSKLAFCTLLCVALPRLVSAADLYEAVEPHMGTLFRIKLYADDKTLAQAAFTAAFKRIAELDNILSDYKPDSELSSLVEGPVRVSEDLGRVIQASLEMSSETDEAFDITVGALTKLWRKARREGALPGEQAIATARDKCGYRKLHYDEATRTLTMNMPGMQLDVGGIAKGYAADEALAVLERCGIHSALVAASGDLAFSDAPPNQLGWKIGIDSLDRADQPFTRVLMLKNAAVSTSGGTEQFLEAGGKRYSHIVDPRTGMGLTSQISVTTVARRGMRADAAATAVSVMGRGKGLAFIERSSDLAAYIVDETPVESSRFRALMGPTVEFVADQPPTTSTHASTIVELSNGDLLAAWFGGTREGAPDVAVWGTRRTAAGWSEPKELVREPRIAAYNPVLFEAPDGLLWLYYKFGPSPGLWSAGRMFSRDGAKSWSEPEHLPAGLYGPIRAKPLVLEDGTILSGTSVESYGTWACWIERSIDKGHSWSRIGPIAAPQTLAIATTKADEPYGIIQPSLIDLGGKHIRLYARSTKAIGRICQADSFDSGLTWSEVKVTSLPNPNSGIDAVRLRDGRILMVYNRSTQARTPLNLAVSRDGVNWNDFHELENDAGEYSYPAMIEARNGDVLITYTWKRQKIRFVRFPVEKIP